MALTTTPGDWTDEQKALRKSLNQYFEALNAGHIEDDAAEHFNRDKWEIIRKSDGSFDIIVGTFVTTVGRWRVIAAVRLSGVGRSAKRAVVAPTAKGNMRFVPVA